MTAVVVYESMFGNTRDLAEAVADGIRQVLPVSIHEVAEAPQDLAGCDLIVIAGPTHAFSMSRTSTREDARTKTHEGRILSEGPGIREWIDGLPRPEQAVPVAVFDTKVRKPKLPGSAAKAAAKHLRARGWTLVAKPQTFHVEGMLGPVSDGETERARAWGTELAHQIHHSHGV